MAATMSTWIWAPTGAGGDDGHGDSDGHGDGDSHGDATGVCRSGSCMSLTSSLEPWSSPSLTNTLEPLAPGGIGLN